MSTGVRSQELYREACALMPAGVNSPVRAFRSVGGSPIFYDSASGCRFTDADGRSFIDFVCSWGPLILGHAHPAVVEAVASTAARGLSFGAPCRQEIELARLMIDAVPQLEMLRFVSSGTEAVMSAVRLARGVTGRDDVLKFDGCYHGHADHLLVSAGSGLATFGNPSSAGVPASFAAHTLVLPLDDEAALEALFEAKGSSMAAVLMEGTPANSGLLVQRPEYLKKLRELCTQYGVLLILDEVITGFRLGAAGASGLWGITPDLWTYGKIIGGGLPVGAYGGRREFMKELSPSGPVYQAGTLSGNPLAMTAGLKTLEIISRPGFYEQLTEKTAMFVNGMKKVARKQNIPLTTNQVGGMFGLFFSEEPVVKNFDQVSNCNIDRFRRFFHLMLDSGVNLAPSAYEAGFISSAHTTRDIELTIEKAEAAFAGL